MCVCGYIGARVFSRTLFPFSLSFPLLPTDQSHPAFLFLSVRAFLVAPLLRLRPRPRPLPPARVSFFASRRTSLIERPRGISSSFSSSSVADKKHDKEEAARGGTAGIVHRRRHASTPSRGDLSPSRSYKGGEEKTIARLWKKRRNVLIRSQNIHATIMDKSRVFVCPPFSNVGPEVFIGRPRDRYIADILDIVLFKVGENTVKRSEDRTREKERDQSLGGDDEGPGELR